MIRVKCPSCTKTMQAPEKYRGKKISCPGCQKPLLVPAESHDPPGIITVDTAHAAKPAVEKSTPVLMYGFIGVMVIVALAGVMMLLDAEDTVSTQQVLADGREYLAKLKKEAADGGVRVSRSIPLLKDQSLNNAIDGRSDGLIISIEDVRDLWGSEGWEVLKDEVSNSDPRSRTFVSQTTDDSEALWGVVAIGRPGEKIEHLMFTVKPDEGISPDLIWMALIGPVGQAAKFSPWSVMELTHWAKVVVQAQVEDRKSLPVVHRGCRLAGGIVGGLFVVSLSSPDPDEKTQTWNEWLISTNQ